MVRTVITPADVDVHLTIAKEYVGRPIEITYLALDELDKAPASTTRKTMADFWNVLSDDTAEKLRSEIDNMRREWE